MRFDWKPESKERYFRKAEAAVKAAGFDDILRVDRDQFSVVKGTVKVHFKPISRDGKTRRWWEAKRTIESMYERNGKYYKALYDQAGNSIAVPIFESIFRKIILHEVA